MNTSTPISNCSESEWRNTWITVGYSMHGTVYLILYVPCLWVMIRPPLINQACYKIMSLMALLDIGALFMSCFVPAILSAIGTPLCPDKDHALALHAASAAMGFWMSYGLVCLTLGVNRLLMLFDESNAHRLFTTTKTVACLSVACLFGLFMATLNSLLPSGYLIYNSAVGINVFEIGEGSTSLIANMSEVYNYALGLSIPVLYAMIVNKLRQRSNTVLSQRAMRIQTLERSVALQSVIISLLTATVAYGYCILWLLWILVTAISIHRSISVTTVFDDKCYMIIPKLSVPFWSYTVIQIIWQAAHGANPTVYLTLNRTIRAEILKLVPSSVDETEMYALAKLVSKEKKRNGLLRKSFAGHERVCETLLES